MTENKKTEKWSSLRLDLQQFAPQEFVAACWIFECIGSGYFATSRDPKKNYTHYTNTSHEIKSPSVNQPNASYPGYLWSSVNNGGVLQGSPTTVYYFQSGGTTHFSASGWEDKSTPNNPNVSG